MSSRRVCRTWPFSVMIYIKTADAAACVSLMPAEENFRTTRNMLFLLGRNTLAHDVIYVAHDVIQF